MERLAEEELNRRVSIALDLRIDDLITYQQWCAYTYLVSLYARQITRSIDEILSFVNDGSMPHVSPAQYRADLQRLEDIGLLDEDVRKVIADL